MKDKILIPKKELEVIIQYIEMQIEKSEMIQKKAGKMGMVGRQVSLVSEMEAAACKLMVDNLKKYLNGTPPEDPEKFCDELECETCQFKEFCKKFRTTV